VNRKKIMYAMLLHCTEQGRDVFLFTRHDFSHLFLQTTFRLANTVLGFCTLLCCTLLYRTLLDFTVLYEYIRPDKLSKYVQ
jgi:hypothetical protein